MRYTHLRRIIGCASFVGVLSAGLVSRATAPAGRYLISSGTVQDSQTGLTWQQTISTTLYTPATAGPYCASLGSGWRVPTIKEMATIVDYTVASPGPTIDSTAFPNTPTGMQYMSATFFTTGQSWVISFTDGTICDNCGGGAPLYVRCVH